MEPILIPIMRKHLKKFSRRFRLEPVSLEVKSRATQLTWTPDETGGTRLQFSLHILFTGNYSNNIDQICVSSCLDPNEYLHKSVLGTQTPWLGPF